MYDLANKNTDGISDMSFEEVEKIREYAQAIANMAEVTLKSKKIPTGSMYWRAAQILHILDNCLDMHEGDNAKSLKDQHGVLIGTDLLELLVDSKKQLDEVKKWVMLIVLIVAVVIPAKIRLRIKKW